MIFAFFVNKNITFSKEKHIFILEIFKIAYVFHIFCKIACFLFICKNMKNVKITQCFTSKVRVGRRLNLPFGMHWAKKSQNGRLKICIKTNVFFNILLPDLKNDEKRSK